MLSVSHQVLLATVLDAGADGLGAQRAAVVLNWDSASASRVEKARAPLKRLVERGRLLWGQVRPLRTARITAGRRRGSGSGS